MTVFNNFLNCTVISFAHSRSSQVVRFFCLFVCFFWFCFFGRDWLMPTWIAKNTFMITFNTCRSWWGGGQVNMVRDRAPKPMHNFLNSSRYKPELCTGSYLLTTVYSFQFRDRYRLQMLPVCCPYVIPRYSHVAVCTRVLLYRMLSVCFS